MAPTSSETLGSGTGAPTVVHVYATTEPDAKWFAEPIENHMEMAHGEHRSVFV